jgi:LacI family transcriptional regulator
MVSQQDIARELGISRELVSKVLSGRMGTTRASSELRKKILRKAKDLGYMPNRNALALFSGRRGTIAIFISPSGVDGAEFTRRTLEGMSDTLRPTMYHMWLSMLPHLSQFKRQVDIRELENRVDGLLVGGGTRMEVMPQLRKVEKAGIPVVTFFDETYLTNKLPNVSVNAQMQGSMATEHLIARGCRRIATICTQEGRYLGYRSALRNADLAFDPQLLVEMMGWSMEDGRQAMCQLLDRNVTFDGVFAHSDHQAYGALQEMLRRGIRVPDDVKILGIDDAPICLASAITLSTVTPELYALGREAVDMISRKIAGEVVESRTLRPCLIQRQST